MATFTFQYGEIKSHCLTGDTIVNTLFTFQYGEIKSSISSTIPTVSRSIYIPVWRD